MKLSQSFVYLSAFSQSDAFPKEPFGLAVAILFDQISEKHIDNPGTAHATFHERRSRIHRGHFGYAPTNLLTHR